MATKIEREPYEMSIRELIERAIGERQSAASYEIVRRAQKKDLCEYLRAELNRIGPKLASTTTTDVNGSDDQEDLAKTLRMVSEVHDPKASIDTSDDPDPICRLAREMLVHNPPYLGQSMNESQKAEGYIYSAADDPGVAKHLPAKGRGFWKFACYDFKSYRARWRRGQMSSGT
jgi:hypothetical protein